MKTVERDFLSGAIWAVVCAVLAMGIGGCLTPKQQKVTYQTLGGLEVASTAVYDSYLTLVFTGKLATNDVPTVSHAYNDFQTSMVFAIVTAKNNTNALAPDALKAEADALVNLITTVKLKH